VSRGSRAGFILPALISSAVILAGLASRSPLREAVTGATPPRVELVLSPAYVLLSPLSRVLDTIGLLSTGEHTALGVTVIGLAMLVARFRGARVGRSRGRRILVSAAVALAVLAVLYAGGAVLPRPTAAIGVTDPSVVRVDFHSHTNVSGDARRGFSPEANRAWHRRGGFDVSYISDHRSFTGADAASSRNPGRAGDGVVLLSAFEGRYLGTFEIFLSFTRADSTTLMDGHRWLREGKLLSGRVPASVVALPSPLIDVQAVARDSAPHVAAIEISDGSPRGFAQSDRDHAAIIHRADALGIALVSGSNSHGWGHVVPAWTLVTVPNWRALTPDSLGSAIEGALRHTPGTSVRVVERRRPMLASPVAMSLTVPVAFAQLLTTLTPAERVVWMVWIWVVWLLRRRARRKEALP